MHKVSREALRKLRDVEDALGHYSLEGDNIQASLEALQRLLDADKVLLYSLTQRRGSDDLVIDRNASVACPADEWRTVFDDFVRGRGVNFGSYNAIHPEPAQRDVVLRSDEIATLTEGRSLEAEAVLYRRFGTFGEDTMRVLVCDGPSMLGWVGIIQPDKTTERQRELLTQVVPAFRRRLAFERRVGETMLTSPALDAALEAVNGAAWVLRPNGRIAYANAAAHARLDADKAGARASLAACAAGAAPPRFQVTALRDTDGQRGFVVIETPEPTSARNPMLGEARRIGLTPAQTRVLERVARGASNATIAAELGVAERTVEAHVTAILVKAHVPSRAALIVQIFRGAPAA